MKIADKNLYWAPVAADGFIAAEFMCAQKKDVRISDADLNEGWRIAQVALVEIPKPVVNTKVNSRQRDVLQHLHEDDEAERYSPLHNIAINLNCTKNDVRLVCRQLARKGLAERVAVHDDDGYIRGSGYGITPAGAKLAAEIGGAA